MVISTLGIGLRALFSVTLDNRAKAYERQQKAGTHMAKGFYAPHEE